ncbi:PIN domain-containing protein [Kineococcus terrestris]|uniref:PIN domain-containing protein n=1 Tax=Kineococcus terrestris TaxID=2044856 RepID=UPI0034DB2619
MSTQSIAQAGFLLDTSAVLSWLDPAGEPEHARRRLDVLFGAHRPAGFPPVHVTAPTLAEVVHVRAHRTRTPTAGAALAEDLEQLGIRVLDWRSGFLTELPAVHAAEQASVLYPLRSFTLADELVLAAARHLGLTVVTTDQFWWSAPDLGVSLFNYRA